MTGVDLLEALMDISSSDVLDKILEGYAESAPNSNRRELKKMMLDNASDSGEQCAAHVSCLIEAILKGK